MAAVDLEESIAIMDLTPDSISVPIKTDAFAFLMSRSVQTLANSKKKSFPSAINLNKNNSSKPNPLNIRPNSKDAIKHLSLNESKKHLIEKRGLKRQSSTSDLELKDKCKRYNLRQRFLKKNNIIDNSDCEHDTFEDMYNSVITVSNATQVKKKSKDTRKKQKHDKSAKLTKRLTDTSLSNKEDSVMSIGHNSNDVHNRNCNKFRNGNRISEDTENIDLTVGAIIDIIEEKEKKLKKEELTYFPSTSHVQQNDVNQFWTLPTVNSFPKEVISKQINYYDFKLNSIPQWLSSCHYNEQFLIRRLKNDEEKIKCLENLIHNKPDYDVQKYYDIFVKRREQILEHQLWTDTYKPITSLEILSNFKIINDLKIWLEQWIEYSKKMRLRKHTQSVIKQRRRTSSSDFEVSSEETSRDYDCNSDSCSGGSGTMAPINAVILRGSVGSGKTSAVYALCKELGIDILELNASTKRTGKSLQQEIQEATQSLQIQSKSNGFNNFFRTIKSKLDDEHTNSNKMCLLLIDDVDIIFDQDEGFLSTLSNLMTISKRPIILITTNSDNTFLQKCINDYPLYEMKKCNVKVICNWLQTLCISEDIFIDKLNLIRMIHIYNRDLRKLLLYLQFYVRSQKMISSTRINRELLDNNELVNCTYTINDCFCDNKINFFKLRNYTQCILQTSLRSKKLNPIQNNEEIKLKEITLIKKLCMLNDSLAFVNTFRHLNIEQDICIKDDVDLNGRLTHFEREKFESFDVATSLISGSYELFNMSIDCRRNVECNVIELIQQDISQIDKYTKLEMEFREALPILFPSDKSRFEYYSIFRTIARTELHRSNTNEKRNRRFHNYLNTLNMTLNNAQIRLSTKILVTKET